jgi:hypothetical protein
MTTSADIAKLSSLLAPLARYELWESHTTTLHCWWVPLEAVPSLSTSGETLTIEESVNLEGENGERRRCRSRARMELKLRLGLLAPAAKTSAA